MLRVAVVQGVQRLGRRARFGALRIAESQRPADPQGPDAPKTFRV